MQAHITELTKSMSRAAGDAGLYRRISACIDRAVRPASKDTLVLHIRHVLLRISTRNNE